MTSAEEASRGTSQDSSDGCNCPANVAGVAGVAGPRHTQGHPSDTPENQPKTIPNQSLSYNVTTQNNFP